MNTLNSFYEPEIYTYLTLASILRQEDKFFIPKVYDHTKLHTIYDLQHIGKDQDDAINTISPPIRKN